MAQNTLFVCILCRFSNTPSSSTPPHPGQFLYDRLREGIANSNQFEQLQVQPVRCMGACSRACVLAWAAPNKLTFMLSELSPTEAIPDILQFSTQYVAWVDGKVPYQQRPETIKQKIHAVLPPTMGFSSS